MLQQKKFVRYVVHQDYYHPHDVPVYQTPTFGGSSPVRVKPEDFIFPYEYTDYRFDIDPHFKPAEQEFPNHTLSQEPEMFLPEEPTFLEFWGLYPFLLMSVTFLLSHEYLIFIGQGTYKLKYFPLAFYSIYAFYQVIGKMLSQDMQFKHDYYWSDKMTQKWCIERTIKRYEGFIKAEEQAKTFSNYYEELTKYKIAYFTHKRKKEKTEETLQKLSKALAAEKFYRLAKERSMREAVENADNTFLKNDEFIKNWDKAVKQILKTKSKQKVSNSTDSADSADSKDSVDSADYVKINEMKKLLPDMKKELEKLATEKQKEAKKTYNEKVELDTFGKIFVKKLFDLLKNLRVYRGPKEAPTEFVVRDLNLFGELSQEEKDKLVNRAEILKGKKDLIELQISRFAEGAVPESLQRLKEKIEDEIRENEKNSK